MLYAYTLRKVNMRRQQTIARSITCSGVGLHTGQEVTLTLWPAAPDTGIIFIYRTASGPIYLPASVRNLVPTELCTSISAKGMLVKTVEHLLSALVGLGVDNVFVELDAGEVPAMDGSAGPFVRLIQAAGIIPQDRPQAFLKIMQPIEVIEGRRRVVLEPYPTTRITYSIQYDHPVIQRQTYSFDWSATAFEQEIADARTFGFLNEVEYLWSRGLGKGGSLENTIVLSESEVVNKSGLRFPDEFVRHKILDLIGDLALLRVPFIGHLVADCAGHSLHTKLVERILDEPDKWILVTADKSTMPMAVKPTPSAYAHTPNASL